MSHLQIKVSPSLSLSQPLPPQPVQQLPPPPHLDRLGRKDPLDQLELQAQSLALLVRLVRREWLARRDRQDALVLRDRLVRLVLQDHLARLDRRVLLDAQALPASLVSQALRASRALVPLDNQSRGRLVCFLARSRP